ncbi:lysophospholipid acyltransferase family protein [Solemya velesiana gill symbiont]|uniref:1-acyl-sn-glycerol-3-phosphate acyltransferase n=1 Tax=Solemya velesiana gill symbiont TaxID=1918948 RepID=A0A1T2KXF7_9GAMM|nr:lysophospholipid acyltransferase family protein [Solemya velesiana gill symbiont]OOZ37547.1 1-acyl-sn-glycerol-3-phosphate acyltransferase [Solemya velesiana gill symbiont]
MILLRSIIYFIGLVLSIILIGLPIAILGWFMPFSWRSRLSNLWGKLNLFMLRVICGLKYEITGIENIPEKSAIVLSKHQSAWETIALRGLLPPEQAWVLKRELMWIPVFGWALAAVEPIAINRKAGRKAAKEIIEKGVDRLKKGRLVVIFPEGTRVAPGDYKRYGIGGAMLASKSGYPVIPIAHNAGVFWRRQGIKKYPGTIQVVIGEPIETEGLNTSKINEMVEDWIEGKVATLPSTLGNQA